MEEYSEKEAKEFLTDEAEFQRSANLIAAAAPFWARCIGQGRGRGVSGGYDVRPDWDEQPTSAQMTARHTPQETPVRYDL